MKIFLVIFSVSVGVVYAENNNVCASIMDYDSIPYNKNCWYNSDVDLLVPDIILKYKYPLEVHEVITQDGYILQVFRIPFGKNSTLVSNYSKSRQPVFLQHGIFSSCAAWVINGNDSIGFVLADQGYDVWLGNSRGSFYGKGHVKLSLKDPRYWNFSYHEMGVYDIPKSLDLIYKLTGRNDIIVMGQSMGTNVQLVYASLLPEHSQKRVKLMVYLAPTIFLKHMKTPFAKLSPFWPIAQKFARKFGINEVLSREQISKRLASNLCFRSAFQLILCDAGVFSIFGFDYTNFSPSIVPVVFAHYPAGSSMNTLIHLVQGSSSSNFAYFDYGRSLNMKYYKTAKPPNYNLTKVAIPGYVIYAHNDWTAPEEGAIELYNMLPNTVRLFKIRDKRYNHIDFFFAKNVKTEVIDEILEVIDKFKS